MNDGSSVGLIDILVVEYACPRIAEILYVRLLLNSSPRCLRLLPRSVLLSVIDYLLFFEYKLEDFCLRIIVNLSIYLY